jgi:hypothetical protein
MAERDLVVVRQQKTAESGEIVAAQLDRAGTCEATVKTLQRAGGHAWLMPHNPAYQPIPADDAAILGKSGRRLAPGAAPARPAPRLRRPRDTPATSRYADVLGRRCPRQ